MSQYEIPDRSDLEGKEVKIRLHRWAIRGPRRGVFLDQGEKGLSIKVPGGGRYVYRHHEVKSVELAR